MKIKYICKFCGKECKNANSHRNHERLCPSNPERNYVSHTIGHKAWNKGLTKETSESVAKFSKTYSERYSGENNYWYGRHHSDETIKKMKKTCGGYRQGSGRGKHGWYKGYYCDSSWELAFVIYNLDHNIKFERNNKVFTYNYNNEVHTYMPDWLIDNKYVEIKGFCDDQWKTKLSQFPEEETLIVLTKIEMQPYIDYVIEKYGKDYIKLYE